LIIALMFVWLKANQITFNYINTLDLNDFKDQLDRLRKDERYPLYQTNVVYLTNRMRGHIIDKSILYSILDKRPKKAQVYWFVKVNVTDEPYTNDYTVDMLGTDFMVKVELYLGFRMRQDVPRY
ncbi:KUP/HAK/KT family potassium transporter, partial [Streptococcus pyogenes]